MPLRRPSALTLSRAHQYTGVPMATGAHGGRIGVDIGGTFTDLVWVDDATGDVRVGKLLTTPKEPAQAVEQGVVIAPPRGGRARDRRARGDPRHHARHQRAHRAQGRAHRAPDHRGLPRRGRDRARGPLRHVRPLHRPAGAARPAPPAARGARARCSPTARVRTPLDDDGARRGDPRARSPTASRPSRSACSTPTGTPRTSGALAALVREIAPGIPVSVLLRGRARDPRVRAHVDDHRPTST